jgi:hypothetical protein
MGSKPTEIPLPTNSPPKKPERLRSAENHPSRKPREFPPTKIPRGASPANSRRQKSPSSRPGDPRTPARNRTATDRRRSRRSGCRPLPFGRDADGQGLFGDPLQERVYQAFTARNFGSGVAATGRERTGKRALTRRLGTRHSHLLQAVRWSLAGPLPSGRGFPCALHLPVPVCAAFAGARVHCICRCPCALHLPVPVCTAFAGARVRCICR